MTANVHDPSLRPGAVFQPWIALPVALLAGAIAWGLIEWLPPAFYVSKEYDVPNLGAPPEKFAAHRAAQNRADRFNAMIDLAIVGALLSGALALREGLARRTTRRAVFALPLGMIAGAGGGWLGSLVYEKWVQTAAQPELIHAVGIQTVVLVSLGLGVGLALAAVGSPPRRAIPAGLLAGVLAGVLYPIAISLLLPATPTESIIPGDRSSGLLYVGVIAVLLGLIVPIACRPRKIVPPAQTPAPERDRGS